MLKKFLNIRNHPIFISITGWLLFPGMYLMLGILASSGLDVQSAFIYAFPLGALGFGCWIAALTISTRWLLKGRNKSIAMTAFVLSFSPLAFMIGLFLTTGGG